MRGISRGVVLGLMSAALLTAAGGGQAGAQAYACVEVHVHERVITGQQPESCSSGTDFLAIELNTSAATNFYLKLDNIDGESRDDR
jgi:hypothetical protein